MTPVELTPEAVEDIRDLDGSARKKVLRAIKKLEDQPELRGEPLGSNPSGNLTNFRKLVVGNREFRIVYRLEADGTVCVVWVVGSRVDAECYEMALSRLQLYGSSDREVTESLRRVLDLTFMR